MKSDSELDTRHHVHTRATTREKHAGELSVRDVDIDKRDMKRELRRTLAGLQGSKADCMTKRANKLNHSLSSRDTLQPTSNANPVDSAWHSRQSHQTSIHPTSFLDICTQAPSKGRQSSDLNLGQPRAWHSDDPPPHYARPRFEASADIDECRMICPGRVC